jgi:hypothetical protein
MSVLAYYLKLFHFNIVTVGKLLLNLFINQEKTKYMPVTKKSHASYPHYLEVGPYKFQVVYSFIYLGSDVNCNNDIGAEIQKRILAANGCFHGLR